MTLTDVELIHLGRDNSIDFVLYADSTQQDLSAVTQIDLRISDEILTSTDSTGGAIRWSGAGYGTGEVRIFAGTATSVSLSTGRFTCALVVYDPTNTNGVVWDDNIPMRVKSNVLTT